MLPSTFGDELKLSNGGVSKVFALGMKEHTAILSGGHSANAAYWFDDISGTWMTSTHYIDSLPVWVEDFNAKSLPDTYLDTEWNTLLPFEAYNSCLPDTNISPYLVSEMDLIKVYIVLLRFKNIF